MQPQSYWAQITAAVLSPLTPQSGCTCQSHAVCLNTHLQKRMNLTKTIRKSPVDVNLDLAGPVYLEDNHANKAGPKYDEEHLWVSSRQQNCGAPAFCDLPVWEPSELHTS